MSSSVRHNFCQRHLITGHQSIQAYQSSSIQLNMTLKGICMLALVGLSDFQLP
jgi:hypothetical protein